MHITRNHPLYTQVASETCHDGSMKKVGNLYPRQTRSHYSTSHSRLADELDRQLPVLPVEEPEEDADDDMDIMTRLR